MKGSRELRGKWVKKKITISVCNSFRQVRTQSRRRIKLRVESSPKGDSATTSSGHLPLNNESDRGKTNAGPKHVKAWGTPENLGEIDLARGPRSNVQRERSRHNQRGQVEEHNIAKGKKVVNGSRFRTALRKKDSGTVTDHKRRAGTESREDGESQRV
jgi:hypothetical protein